ncbi:hypothetical protein T484DRAFT_1786009 [Baffinella frigidus]|nr:hypothetical protein T484DRAFT_1786009 [Cryptophyta sp. CCMP2293]
MTVISSLLLSLLPTTDALHHPRYVERQIATFKAVGECLTQWGVAAERGLCRPMLLLCSAILEAMARSTGGLPQTAAAGVNKALCCAALELVEICFASCGALVDKDIAASTLQALTQALLADLNSTAAPPDPSPEAGAVRLAGVKALWAAMLTPSACLPSTFAQALLVLRLASNDTCHQLRATSTLALAASATLLQPRAPTLFLPAQHRRDGHSP